MESLSCLLRRDKFVDISVASYPSTDRWLVDEDKLDVGVLWDTDRKSTGKSAEDLGVRVKKKSIYA